MEGTLWFLLFLGNSSHFLPSPVHLLWMSLSYALSTLLTLNLRQLGKQQIDRPGERVCMIEEMGKIYDTVSLW